MKRLINISNFLLVALFLCSSMSGCNRYPPVSGAIFCETFITSYIFPDKIHLRYGDGCIPFYVGGSSAVTSGEIFDRLSQYYNDLSYNKWVVNGPNKAILGEIKSIQLETIEAFDEHHPAGSDMSDLVELQYISYYEFVQNGYQEEGSKIKEDYTDMSPYFYVDGAKIYKVKLSEVNYSDMQLISTDFVLKFLGSPKEKGVYHFKLTFQVEYSASETLVEYEF